MPQQARSPGAGFNRPNLAGHVQQQVDRGVAGVQANIDRGYQQLLQQMHQIPQHFAGHPRPITGSGPGNLDPVDYGSPNGPGRPKNRPPKINDPEDSVSAGGGMQSYGTYAPGFSKGDFQKPKTGKVPWKQLMSSGSAFGGVGGYGMGGMSGMGGMMPMMQMFQMLFSQMGKGGSNPFGQSFGGSNPFGDDEEEDDD